MANLDIKITVRAKQARGNMRSMAKRAENFKPVFRWAQRELEKANRANFATQGAASGKPWMPLDNEYARWKLDHHGTLPILVVTGTLQESLVRLRGAPNEIDMKTAVFGTDVKTAKGKPLAVYHQLGTRKMPARTIMFTPPLFASSLALKVAQHVVYGQAGIRGPAGIAQGAVPLLKGLF